MAGINGILATLSIIICYFNITYGAIEIALDGKSTINTVSSDDGLHCKQNSFDIFQDIHNQILLLPVTIKLRWVEGHQEKSGKVLNWWVKKNQQADIHAKALMA